MRQQEMEGKTDLAPLDQVIWMRQVIEAYLGRRGGVA